MTAAEKKAAREAAAAAAELAKQTEAPQAPLASASQAEGKAAADVAEDALSDRMPAHMQQSAPKAQATVATEAQHAKLEALDLEIRELDLETKRILLEQTRETNQNYRQTKEQKLRQAEQAQRILSQATWTQLQIEAGCSHQTGGFGLEDLYSGDNKPSIVAMDLPVAGRKVLLCFRCMKTVVTPDPNLKATDIEKYIEQFADYKEFLKLERASLAKLMGGPVFAFDKAGIPVNPEMV